MSSFDHILKERLNSRERDGLLRVLKTSKNGLVDFTSNDYLGLSRSADLFLKIKTQVDHLTTVLNGATGSRLLSGNSHYTEQVENKLASIFKSEGSLIFNSGYSANLAVLSSLPQRNDTILYDELAHACMKDGARLSLAKRLSFKHNDLNDLALKLEKSTGNIYIAVESVYSMDGDECPLRSLVDLADKFNATIILDEAHSTGLLTADGAGLAVSLGLQDRIGVRVYTFGKAMGIHGACVVGSKNLMRYLTNFARPFIYTTALPPHSIVAIECAFDFLKTNLGLQNKLNECIDMYLRAMSNFNFKSISKSSIQTWLVPGNENARSTAEKLQTRGFDIRPILSPTVPAGTERLRICLHAFNTEEEIKNLAKEIESVSFDKVTR